MFVIHLHVESICGFYPVDKTTEPPIMSVSLADIECKPVKVQVKRRGIGRPKGSLGVKKHKPDTWNFDKQIK